jgi:cell division septum initiation protein DivIVA
MEKKRKPGVRQLYSERSRRNLMTFQRVNGGYDPAQVDEYIAALREGYLNMEREYKELETEKTRLAKELEKRPDAAVVGQALIDAQRLAKLVAETAGAQALRIVEQAKNEAARVLWDAKKELDGIEAAKANIEREVRALASIFGGSAVKEVDYENIGTA